MMPNINGKTTIFDLLWNCMIEEQPRHFYNIFHLCVRGTTNNYIISNNLMERCFHNKYNPDIFDTRSHKLFRKSLANFIKKGKLGFNKI